MEHTSTNPASYLLNFQNDQNTLNGMDDKPSPYLLCFSSSSRFSPMASLPLRTTPNPNPHFKSTDLKQSHKPKPSRFTNIHESQNKLQILNKSYFHHISALCKETRIGEAVSLLIEMDFKELDTGPEIYGELLQGCVYERALFTGQQIHARILKNGDFFAKNEYIETKLVIFYAKCDLSMVANELFGRVRKQNVFSWAAIIGLNCRVGCNEEALMGFCRMQKNGLFPDNFVVPNALKACSALGLIEFGKGVHGYALKMGFGCCVYVASSLVDMYGKCGVLEYAKKVFGGMSERNVVAWNSIIVGYVQNGMSEEAMRVFYDMRVEGIEPSRVTVASFLSASANVVDGLEEARQGHALAVLSGLELDSILGSSLINFYSKVGLIKETELVFSKMIERDVVTWNLLISCYVQNGQVEKAIDTCHQMRLEKLRFDSVTLASLLSASANTSNIGLGKVCHVHCIRNHLDSDVIVASSIVDMYAKCDRIKEARWIFNNTRKRDLMLWNTLIAAYSKLGMSGEALKLFYQMQLEGVPPNVVSWNSVILGFLRNGQVAEAEDLFSQMQSTGIKPNLITWATLISGMSENGFGDKSIHLFEQMQAIGLRPNTACIIALLSACIDIVSIQHGRAVHGYITRYGLSSSMSIATSLINMYAKCGSIGLARKLFDMLLVKELPMYNVMISGYAMHGQAEEAFALFKHMQREGMKPDGITFTAILSAFSHAGIVKEGLDFFNSMVSKHQMKPSMEHYGCVVSLLSRCGSLEEALKFIQAMPFVPDAQILGSLLAACKEQSEAELGEYLYQYLYKLEPESSANYVSLSNTYAAAGRWDDVRKLRDSMKKKGLTRNPGCSWIQIGTEVHVFVAGDTSHPQTKVINETLALLEKEMRLINYDYLFINTKMS